MRGDPRIRIRGSEDTRDVAAKRVPSLRRRNVNEALNQAPQAIATPEECRVRRVAVAVLLAPAWSDHNVSVSVALLFAVLGSVTPDGTDTVAVSEIEPVADALIVPVAL